MRGSVWVGAFDLPLSKSSGACRHGVGSRWREGGTQRQTGPQPHSGFGTVVVIGGESLTGGLAKMRSSEGALAAGPATTMAESRTA